MGAMEGSSQPAMVGSWLRCYRCWSQELEVQVHYEGIHRIDPVTGERAEVVDELQEAVVQCLDCMHDQPHLAFHNGRIEPVEDRWERMVAGTPWVASCTVTVDADSVETCSGPEAADSLAYAAFGDHGTREFFTHVRFHKHDDDQIVVHLLVELYARSNDEAMSVLEEAARGQLKITPRAGGGPPPPSNPSPRGRGGPPPPPRRATTPTERRGVEVVEQAPGLRLAVVVEHDCAARPVRMRRGGVVQEQGLVGPGAGVDDPQPPVR